jgi:hypothetical protein
MLWAFLFIENMIIAVKNCHKAYFVTAEKNGKIIYDLNKNQLSHTSNGSVFCTHNYNKKRLSQSIP